MSAKNEIDRLRFPSGVSVRQIKSTAKKLRKETGEPLHHIQRKLAAENGLDMPWEQALATVKESAPCALRAPTVSESSSREPAIWRGRASDRIIQPSIQIEYQGVTGQEIEWFKALPHVAELLGELHSRGHEHGVELLQVTHPDQGLPRINVTLDLLGCSLEQEAAAQAVPHLEDAFRAVAEAGQHAQLKFTLKAVTRSRDYRFFHHAVQTTRDLVRFFETVDGLTELAGSRFVQINARNDGPTKAPMPGYSKVRRSNDGFELEFLRSGNEHATRTLSSKEFGRLADIAHFATEENGQYCLRFLNSGDIEMLQILALVKPSDSGQTPLELTALGAQLIRACGNVKQDMYAGNLNVITESRALAENYQVAQRMMMLIEEFERSAKGYRQVRNETTISEIKVQNAAYGGFSAEEVELKVARAHVLNLNIATEYEENAGKLRIAAAIQKEHLAAGEYLQAIKSATDAINSVIHRR